MLWLDFAVAFVTEKPLFPAYEIKKMWKTELEIVNACAMERSHQPLSTLGYLYRTSIRIKQKIEAKQFHGWP